ncbi:DUF3370 domain-containing protein [Leptolyngbya sp. GGD]|uniref:DUF3370 domain-containing protein n=1 Tax=Leptolyngbya sp. GGD TaxID=2997907 RepID=UPI00227A48CE|nr:DUF3370 domain-containing protein [Leptolyngbya sp. GGD]MCY6491739.1 DUF3370 domain-containing protein [Leptolyngbya sp. GGD]
MLSLLSSLILSQATPAPTPTPTPTPTPPPQQTIVEPQEMRVLPGELDSVPVFNSNSPEVVQKEGILLSTFPAAGKQFPSAHLNQSFSGRFDIFTHHIAKALTPEDLRTLYLGVIAHNPGKTAVTIDILQAASYLSQPDAPFISLDPAIANDDGKTFAGPGSRAVGEVLRGLRQDIFPAQVVIPPGESRMLMNLPIPVKPLTPPLNGRSSLMRLRSTGEVYLASLGMFAKQNPDSTEREPTVEEWEALLNTADLSGPRDKTPTPIEETTGTLIYGRVAGVAVGSQWNGRILDANRDSLSIPAPGAGFSYGLATLHRGTLGTNQNQSAKMIRRYPDTAYQAHGNYAIQYSLTMPLENTSDQPQTVVLTVETPLKREDTDKGLRFLEPAGPQMNFRGTVRWRFNDDQGLPQTHYVHLVQRRGQQGAPLVTLQMQPQERRLVQFDFLYPPDATPPQVLTIKTLKSEPAP